MKYHVSRDVGHLKFTTIKNPNSPIQVPCIELERNFLSSSVVPCMTNNFTLVRYSNNDLCKL